MALDGKPIDPGNAYAKEAARRRMEALRPKCVCHGCPRPSRPGDEVCEFHGGSTGL